MTAASRSHAAALWRARFASGLLPPTYTTKWDTTSLYESPELGGAIEQGAKQKLSTTSIGTRMACAETPSDAGGGD